jgi:hypothetical protein
MMNKSSLLIGLFAALLVTCSCRVQADAIALLNPGFESEPQYPTEGNGINGVLQDWTITQFSDPAHNATGVQYPSEAQADGGAYEGTYCTFVNTWWWGGGAPVRQVTSAIYEANTTYTFSIYAASRKDIPAYLPDAQLQFWDVTTDSLVAEATIQLTTHGAWTLLTVQFTAESGASYLGHNVVVQFNAMNDGQLLFDSASLDATSVPEPATVCLLTAGGMIAVIRRKRR